MEKIIYKEGDILVSESAKIISVLKGNYNDGEFRDYANMNPDGLDLNPCGVWDGIKDWRPATAKEKRKFCKAIEARRKVLERKLIAATKLQELISCGNNTLNKIL